MTDEAPKIERRFTPELEARILKRIRNGNAFLVAAMAEGVPKRLHYEWLAAARDPESVHAKRRPKLAQKLAAYLEKVDQHYALFEADCVDKLNDPPDDWYEWVVDKKGELKRGKLDKGHINRLTWLLERTRRERFGLRVTVDDLRDEAASRVLDRVRQAADAEFYSRLVGYLDPEGGAEGEDGEGDGLAGADDSLPLC